MKNITMAAVFGLYRYVSTLRISSLRIFIFCISILCISTLLASSTVLAADENTPFSPAQAADLPHGVIEISDPMHVLHPYLADEMVLPRDQAGLWIRPRLTAERVVALGERTQAADRKAAPVPAAAPAQPLNTRYSNLPEPPMASMLLLGLILLFLTIEEEPKGEKFTEE